MAFKWTPNFCWQWIRRQICTNCFSGHSMTHKHKISLMALNTIQELYHRKVSQKLYTWSYYNYGRNYSAHHIERQNNFESLHAYHFTRPWQPITLNYPPEALSWTLLDSSIALIPTATCLYFTGDAILFICNKIQHFVKHGNWRVMGSPLSAAVNLSYVKFPDYPPSLHRRAFVHDMHNSKYVMYLSGIWLWIY